MTEAASVRTVKRAEGKYNMKKQSGAQERE
jgi:hypothetical protein